MNFAEVIFDKVSKYGASYRLQIDASYHLQNNSFSWKIALSGLSCLKAID